MSQFIHPRMFEELTAFYPAVCAVQAATEVRDEVGQPIEAWANVPGLDALPCRVSPSGGSERRQPNQVYSLSTHVINLAGHYATISTKHRAVVALQAYDILLVEHDGNQQMTKLVCQVVR